MGCVPHLLFIDVHGHGLEKRSAHVGLLSAVSCSARLSQMHEHQTSHIGGFSGTSKEPLILESRCAYAQGSTVPYTIHCQCKLRFEWLHNTRFVWQVFVRRPTWRKHGQLKLPGHAGVLAALAALSSCPWDLQFRPFRQIRAKSGAASATLQHLRGLPGAGAKSILS